MTKERKQRRPARQQRKISTTQILMVVGAAIVAVALLVILNSGGSTRVATDSLPYQTGVTSEGEPYKGSADAPIQLVEYSDFLCGHCANFATAVDALSPDYIDTGKVQVIFRNYAFLAPESLQAAQAAECALDQGADKFWMYHDMLFANQSRSSFSNARLKYFAERIGLDTATFDTCLDSGAKAAEIQADLDEGLSQDVKSTPTWFIDGQIYRGALPESQLRQLFDSMLSQGS